MKVLDSPIKTITFDDVVAFCLEGHREGVQIDYKRDFPSKFGKYFASFSNTRGGAIIIGVEEDLKSGIPSAWEGVSENGVAKQVERIHQEAGNVDPLPSYEVHVTNAVNGRCFVIVRILEGDNTPYWPQNDANIWIRTGSVSKPIDIASPDWLELLFGKREKAEKARNLYLSIAQTHYKAGLVRADQRRKESIRSAQAQGKGDEKFIYQKNLGSQSSMCLISLMPFFPNKALASPQEVRSALDELRYRGPDSSVFPQDTYLSESVPFGVLTFISRPDNGYIECQQLFSHGLIQSKFDIVWVKEDGHREMYLSQLVNNLVAILSFARNFYARFGYQGVLSGGIELENMNGVRVTPLQPDGFLFFNENKNCLLDAYNWELRLDTRDISGSEELRRFVHSLIHDIYWSLGYESVNDKVIDKYLEQKGLFLEQVV